MRRLVLSIVVALLATGTASVAGAAGKAKGAKPEWQMNATAIEACSCPMFCQCYFGVKPAGHSGHEGHGEEHFCRFNNAYKINKGYMGDTKLDGAKFWIYGDLGDDFSQGQMGWAVVTFDKATTPAQRDAIGKICGHLFPVKWQSLTTAEGDIEWTASKDEAHALLDGGKTAEVALTAGNLNRDDKGQPAVLKNIKYWGAPRNDGFVMMPNTVEAVRAGDKTFEFKGTNGFMITVDIDANTAPPAAGM